jgi:hypothetical protein
VIGSGEFEHRTRTAGESGRRSTTQGQTYRDLAPAAILREAFLNTALLIYGNLPPAKIRLRPWFEDRHLRRLSDPSGTREVRR